MILKDALNGRAECAVLGGLVALFDGDVHFEQEIAWCISDSVCIRYLSSSHDALVGVERTVIITENDHLRGSKPLTGS